MLLVAGVVAVLTGLAALVPEDPPVTTAAGTLADPVPVGEAWRTFADGAPELDVAVTDVDPDSDAAPAGIVAASDRVVAATVRIESHGVLTRTIDLVELDFRTPSGDLVDTTTTDLWAPGHGPRPRGHARPGRGDDRHADVRGAGGRGRGRDARPHALLGRRRSRPRDGVGATVRGLRPCGPRDGVGAAVPASVSAQHADLSGACRIRPPGTPARRLRR
ncbi:hypothetical protein [Clavibacter tessellarius]|uniref:hypothetical protein n=1 Tax=Clavibacter tessellarius TaxID=31965 RepID=UPI0032459A4E